MPHDNQTRQDQILLELLPDRAPVHKNQVRATLSGRDPYWNENEFRQHLQSLLVREEITENDGALSLRASPTIYEYAVWLTRVTLAQLINENSDAFYGRQILDTIRDLYPENQYPHWRLNKASYFQYLTRMANDPNSRVVRVVSGYGYTLRPFEEQAIIAPDAENHAGVAGPTAPPERTVYRLLADWLSALDYKTKVVADIRAGGQWGNPDVVGVRIYQTIWNAFDVEIVTIEAKRSYNDWRRWIFEAIAHKRFSDRSYFAFPVFSRTAVVEDIPDYRDMRHYGEQYGIGILAVFVDPEVFQGDAGQHDDNAEDALDRVKFVEILPAPLIPVLPIKKDEFLRIVLRANGIADLMDLGDE